MIGRSNFLIAGIAMIILCLPLLAGATAPQRISYQGRLTDATGTAVPDNPALAVTFNIYPTDVGPGTLWTETQNVAVKSGLFSAELGAVTALANTVFTDSVRWLGVTVAGMELTPRTRLVSAPYAYRVATIDGTSGGTVNGTISSGSSSQNGEVKVYSNGSVNPVVKVTRSISGGAVDTYDEAGNFLAGFESDAAGTGGFLYTYRSTSSQGFTVDGNYNSTEEPRVTIAGSTQSVNFRMDQTGDAAVVLPVDAVDASEILDEPGVAAALNGNSITLTGAVQTLLSRTITLPADGYVLAIGTCQPMVTHVNGTISAANFGVSTSSASFPANQDIGIWLPAVIPSGTYNFPVTAQTIFTLSAGAHTIYLLGDQISGSVSAWDMQLSLIYIPTSYGTVSAPAGAALPDDITMPATLWAPDLEAERIESIESNNARIARELAAMKAELEAVKKQLEQGNRNNPRD